jgi:hypothetical protein
MNKTILAYIAGYLDGEGAFSIRRAKDRSMIQGYRYYLNMRVTSTNKDILLYLKSLFDGTVNEQKLNKNIGKWKTAWYWTIGSRKALKMIKLIYPYLRIKKPQAKIMFKFSKTIQNNTEKITQKLWEKRRNLKTQINILNKRGL